MSQFYPVEICFSRTVKELKSSTVSNQGDCDNALQWPQETDAAWTKDRILLEEQVEEGQTMGLITTTGGQEIVWKHDQLRDNTRW